MFKHNIVYVETLHDGSQPGIITTYLPNGKFTHTYHNDSIKDIDGRWIILEGTVYYAVRDACTNRHFDWELDKNSEFILHEIVAQAILEG